MDKFKGTPGPWEIEVASINSIEVVSDGSLVSEIISDSDTDLLTELEWNNARLIAAAPDLLTALQDLWRRSTNLFGELTIDEVKADPCLQALSMSIDKAKEVVSKALGEGG